MANKLYDTCSLLKLQSKAFKENFFISNITLNELEEIKTSATKDEEVKWRARKVLHLLKDNENKYTVITFNESDKTLLQEYDLPHSNDSKIIICARKAFNNGTLITDDLACYHLAKSIGLKVSFSEDDEEEYIGYKEIQLSETEMADFYGLHFCKDSNIYNLLENEYLLIKDDNNNIIDKYKWVENHYEDIPFISVRSNQLGKIAPINKDPYQACALDSLTHNQITMLKGPAGSGKSLLSMGYLFSLLEEGQIEKIIIFCNTVATKGSAKLGFYPGSRTEKLLDSQIGNFLVSKIGDRCGVERLIEDGQLILLPMSDIRGFDTSGMRAGIYITEAQNLDVELMKLALQRIGEDSICILDGDADAQVDLSMYAGSNNGMKRVSQVFKGQSCYGEVKLKNIHRSKIAKIAEGL